MAEASDRGWTRPQLWVEVFAILNVGFLTFDIYLAHSVNQFRNPAEFIPLIFSATAPLVLIFGLAVRYRWPPREGFGILGRLGRNFRGPHRSHSPSPESLLLRAHSARTDVFGAVCRAPRLHRLGFLLVMNRMVASESLEWAQWVVLLTLGGFIGNFVISLSDHAENGFFNPLEWVPVVASAIAIGFLTVPLVTQVSRLFIDLCAAVLLFEAAVALWGFLLHAEGNLRGPSVHPFDNFIYGAPPMAPLLFPNLMVLGIIALWQLRTTHS